MTTPIIRPDPRPTVQLTGRDGNAFVVLGACIRALRQAGCSKEQIAAFQAEATAGAYHHLLGTAMEWLDVE